MRGKFVVLTTLALAVALLPATAAQASPISCGSTITSSVLLTKNLNCTGDGLIVGANNLTIDLNGHRINGAGVGAGIQVSPSLPAAGLQLTVQNGTLRDFGTAIDVENDGLLTLSGLTLAGNTLGLGTVALGLTAAVSSSSFQSNTTGVGSNSEVGAGFLGTLQVAASNFRTNLTAIDLIGNSRSISVDSSVFTGNGTGLHAYNGTVSVTNSHFSSNPQAIVADQDGLTITGNVIRGSQVGLDVMDDFYGLTVTGNTITGSGIGIRVTGTNGGSSPTVAGNLISGNGSAGIFVNLVAGGLTLQANTVRNNGSSPGSYTDPGGNPLIDGIWANRSTITGNTAIGNAGYGIAAHLVTDGGGNIARGNGNPAQCLGVSCTAH
jgi:hypothetical protein